MPGITANWSMPGKPVRSMRRRWPGRCKKPLNIGREGRSILKYSTLNPRQLRDFLEHNAIEALDIKEIENYTVILYQTSDGQGSWQLTSDQNERVSGSHGASSGLDFSTTKVCIGRSGGGGREGGYINFITLVIYDKEILEKAEKLIAHGGSYHHEEALKQQKGIIIPAPDNKRKGMLPSIKAFDKLEIKLLDSMGNILFHDWV